MIIIIIEIYFHRLFFSPTYTRSIEYMYTFYLSSYIFELIHRLVLSKQYVCTFDICKHGNIARDVFLDNL
jgi:hypothetical protein